MLRRLVKHGIKCSYVLINATSYVMPEVRTCFFFDKIKNINIVFRPFVLREFPGLTVRPTVGQQS